jgi:hypothetical protein
MDARSVASITPPSMVDPSEIEYVPLLLLLKHVNERNPKDHDIGDIMASIVRHGFVGYVTFDPSVPMMVAGHGRLKALEAMMLDGYDAPKRIIESDQGWLVPTYKKVFESDHERNAYTIGDNQLTIKGGWLIDGLTDMLEELAKKDPVHGLDGTGYDREDLDTLLADKNYQPPAPPPPAEIETQFGIWIRVGDKIQENRLADLLHKYGYEQFRRFSED